LLEISEELSAISAQLWGDANGFTNSSLPGPSARRWSLVVRTKLASFLQAFFAAGNDPSFAEVTAFGMGTSTFDIDFGIAKP
jgi:hypothetical protein